MLETFEKWDLPNCCRWYTVIFLFKSYLFECNCFTSNFVNGLVNNTISSLSEFIQLLISVDLWCRLNELLWLLFACGRLWCRHNAWWGLLSSNILLLSGALTRLSWSSNVVVRIVIFHRVLICNIWMLDFDLSFSSFCLWLPITTEL